jgi:hypothetical protein
MTYRDSLAEHLRPSIFLGDLPPADQSVRLSCYVQYLHGLGYREAVLERKISGLKMVFLEALVDVRFFSSDLVTRTRRAARPTPQEAAALESERRRKQSLPASLDLIWPVREEFWTGESWLCPGLDRRAVWLAIAIGLDSGCRMSNLAQGHSNRTNHVIKAEAVVVVYMVDQDPNPRRAIGGEVFRRVASELVNFPACITKVEYHYTTGKIDMPTAWHTLGRRTVQESTLLEDLVTYLVVSRVQGSDELFTRYPGPLDKRNCARKVLTQRQVKAGLDWAAERAGLPRGSIKLSGVRRGNAETSRAAGVSHEELVHGRWCVSSSVPYEHYLSRPGECDGSGQPVSRGAWSLGDQGGAAFTTEKVKALAVSRGVMDSSGEYPWYSRCGGLLS